MARGGPAGAPAPPVVESAAPGYLNRVSPLDMIRTLRNERRAVGWKGLFKKRGWKLVLAFVVFYLIRDVILYVIIPLGTAAWLLK